MLNSQLNEGLRSNDLKEMIAPIFEIDTYRSKMGEDRDVVVLSFTAKDRNPAKDLMEFIEKSYSFVLDADVSSGENKNGEYYIFVEIPRSNKLSEQIKDLTYGINKLTGINEFKFKYHKGTSSYAVNEASIKDIIPNSPVEYDAFVAQIKTESIKSFFNKTLMDDLSLEQDIITIHKPFDTKLKFRLISEESIVLEEKISVDEDSSAEVFWLTKVLGDYDISKFGDNLLFTNGDKNILLQRI